MKVHHIIAAFVMLLILTSSCGDKYRFETETGRVYQIDDGKYAGLIEVGDTAVISIHSRSPRTHIHQRYKGSVPESYTFYRQDSSMILISFHKAIRLD